MSYTFENPNVLTLTRYLKEAKTIAIVGLSERTETTAYRVAQYLKEAGYTIIPVNPKYAEKTILGEKVYARLQDIPVAVDIVNVFRRSEFLADVARDFIDTDASVYWAQLGLESQEAEQVLKAAGRQDIVMNRCIKKEHQALVAN